MFIFFLTGKYKYKIKFFTYASILLRTCAQLRIFTRKTERKILFIKIFSPS